MKYIRTIDEISGERIYENDIPEPKNEDEKEILQKLRDYIGEVIIKQADTIEELCDEIVEIIDGKAQVVYADISFNDLAIAKIRGKNNAIVYGAIWTDKGLIYVAKMNESGCLELL